MSDQDLDTFGPEFDKYKPAQPDVSTQAPAPIPMPAAANPAPQAAPAAAQAAPTDFDTQFDNYQKSGTAPTASTSPPDFDTAFEEAQKNQFKPSVLQRAEYMIDPFANAHMDNYYANMSDAQKQYVGTTSAGKIMKAFGQGFSEGSGGDEEIGFSKDTEEELKKAGVDLAAQAGLSSSFKAVLATPAAQQGLALIKGAAVGVDLLMRIGAGAISGTAAVADELARASGITAAVNKATGYSENSPLGLEGLANDPGMLMVMDPFAPHPDALPHPVARAQVNGVLDDEAVYMGVKEPTPEQQTARAETAAQMVPETEPAAAPDIHAAARAIAPETFQKFDALDTEQERLRAQLAEAGQDRQAAHEAEAPHAQEDIEAERAKLEGANKKNSKIYQARIDEMEAANEEHRANAPTEDTPAMADIRQKIQELDYQKRDLAPDVTDAYNKVRDQYPEEPEAEVQSENAEEIPEATEEKIEPPPPLENEEPQNPIEEQKAAIVADTKAKLIAAGRPEAEADAAAQLVAEHYATRAERFQGKRGTAEELYKESSPEIRKGHEVKAKARELAQKGGRELNQKQIKTETSAFKKWFGDSKVIDEDGNPKVVYHGTDKDIEQFKTDGEGKSTGTGAFFSDDPGNAGSYAPRNGGNTNPVYISLKNPVIVDAEGKHWSGIGAETKVHLPEIASNASDDALLRELGIEPGKKPIPARQAKAGDLVGENLDGGVGGGVTTDKIARWARQNGYDGVIFKNMTDRGPFSRGGESSVPGNVYVVFHPEQIKSIFNQGTFDAQEARSLLQKAQGKIRLATDQAKAMITLMKTANASTFIHETGHAWFEELVADAQHEHATPQMKADADALLKYAGADADGNIPTRGHEKVARSFERYLMEGVAPSKGLARVFAQFKNWLTKIYQTADRLKAPINDDIRAVFDRMLSIEPEKTVIAPDHEPGARLADIHEEEAMSTPPEHAAAARDAIEREIDYTAKLHDPEVKDAIEKAKKSITSGSATEASGQPTGAASDAASGAGTGNDATAQEPNPVATGGGDTGTESSAVPAGEVTPDTANASAAGTSADTAGTGKPAASGPTGSGADGGANPPTGTERPRDLPTGEAPNGPNETYGNPQSKLIDKAGNIRLDNLNTPEDVNQVIREAANENGDFIDQRRGVVPDSEVLSLADALGMKPSDINARKLGEAFNAEQIVAARKLLIQSATEVRNLMAKAATGGEADIMAYAEAKARHIMVQGQVAGITAEAGRALRAFRALQGGDEAKAIGDFLQQATGRTLNQLQEEAKMGMNLDTPQQVSKFINDSQKPSFGDMLLEYWVNGLISGPATHTTYMVGNTLSAIWKAVPETGVASLIGKAHEALGHEASGIRLGEVGAQLKGAKEGLPNALSAAGKALKSGVTTLLPGEEGRAMPLQPDALFAEAGRIANENISWKQLGNDMFGTFKGMRDAWVSAGDLAKPGVAEAAGFGLKRSALGSIPDITLNGKNILPVGSVIRTPARAIAAIHSFFRTVNYSMDKAALAYRTAADEGLAGNDFAARVGDIVNNPSEEIMKKSRESATTMTLMGSGGDMTKAMSKLTNVQMKLPVIGNIKPLKFIDPFVHIGSNVIDQSLVQRTPLGLLSSELRKDLSGLNGPERRDFAQARMLVGTSLAITVGGLAQEGLISGSGPSDPKQAAAWRMLGNQPHSVRIGDMWYDTHRLGPLGMLIGVAADMSDVAGTASSGDMTHAASMLVGGIAHNILDESFMRGPSELIKAITDHDRYGDKYIQNFLSSFVPFSVGLAQEARAIDPYSRQVRSTMDAIKNKIPYLSEELMPRRDVWGEPIANKDVLGPDGFSAIYESKVNNDPTTVKLLSLGSFPGRLDRKIRNVELNDQQYDDYSRIAGKMTKMRLDALVNQPNFSAAQETQQKKAIQSIINKSREDARGMIMMQYPDIMVQATQNKLKPLDKKQ